MQCRKQFPEWALPFDCEYDRVKSRTPYSVPHGDDGTH